MPRDRLDLTLHCPFGVLYKEPLGYIEGEELKGKKLYSIVAVACLYLNMHPFVPLEHFVLFPSLPLSCEIAIDRWMIEGVEAQVEDSVSSVHRCAGRGCHFCNL